MKILLDADALIKLTCAGLKELVVDTFEVFIPPGVKFEVVDEGRRLGHADALIVEQNLKHGRLHTADPVPADPAASALVGGGDRDVVSLSLADRFAAVVTDDGALLGKLKLLGVSATVPAALILAVGRRRKLATNVVRSHLEALRPYLSRDEYVTYLLLLEARYPRK